jgi:molecular chaperone DnaK
VNPDEVVALGAAYQAGVLSGDLTDVRLVDVTPLTLAIETLHNEATPILPRNTAIPTDRTEVFTTASDNQVQVEIHVVQGERPRATDCKSLGRFTLDGILPAPRGVPQIAVTFSVDANGILQVSATDKATGREQGMRVQPTSGLTADEIARMVAEATAHAGVDARARELGEIRNAADRTAYAAERTVRMAAGRLRADDRADLAARIQRVRTALAQSPSSVDAARLAQETADLDAALARAGAAAYAASGSEQLIDAIGDHAE